MSGADRRTQLRRLHSLARVALARHGLVDVDVVFHGFETNALYRITGRDVESRGETRLVLRLATPGWRTLTDLESEAMWLDALARDTDVGAPRVLRDAHGCAVIPIEAPDTHAPWNATLMTWLPGRLLGTALTARNIERMGALFATLHGHARRFRPPAGFTTRVFDRFLSRGEPEVLVESAKADACPSQHVELLQRIVARADAAYRTLDRGDLRVIHCDLWHDNIKVDRGRLRPFDFEDTVWGYRAHDIAMAMLDLREVAGEDRYVELLAEFRAGYEATLDWPDGEIDDFQVGRLLWKINHVALHERPWLCSMIERHAPMLERYESTGRLRLAF